MTLILASTMPLAAHRPAVEAALGRPVEQARALWVANAADVEDGSLDWVDANRKVLVGMGFTVTDLDLRLHAKHPGSPALAQVFAQADLLWVNGGNTFYLRWLLRASGADQLITQAVREEALVYGGGSAGAIVAGPTLNHFQAVDAPQCAPELILQGMGLTSTVVVPHIDNPQFSTGCLEAGRLLRAEGFPTVELTDSQIAVFTNNEVQVS